MFSLMYESKGTVPYYEAEIDKILESSRHFNQKHSVTGILFFYRNRFVQYIEGDKNTVHSLFHQRISLDRRHKDIKVLMEGQVHTRVFEGWSMKYCFMEDYNEDLEKLLQAPAEQDVTSLLRKLDAQVEAIKL